MIYIIIFGVLGLLLITGIVSSIVDRDDDYDSYDDDYYWMDD